MQDSREFVKRLAQLMKEPAKKYDTIYMGFAERNRATDSADVKEKSSALNPSTLITANENDGKIVLTFLENDLEVKADFYPPGQGGTAITPEYINELLGKFNIVYGVDREEIEKAYKLCVEESKIVRDVIIARGDLPVNEILEYMQLNPHLGHDGQENEGLRMDHKSRSPFIIVKKGEALAKQKSRKPGLDGKDVHGKILNFGVTRPEGVLGGENTRMEGRFLLSCINGQMLLSRGVVSVRDSLVIKGPVGYATGNIIFPGDVDIEGPVSDGFKIYSGGSVTIKQTFDVTDANIRDDLNVAGGIIGRGQALVKVGGALKTKFIENCHIACRKTAVVDSEIINSDVFTLETLEMGDRGKIVGGEIYAVKGIRTGSIGKKTGSKAARLHCGIDFTLEQEKEKNNGLLRILAAKLDRLKELMEDPSADEEKKGKMETLLKRLEDERHQAGEKVAELLGRINTYTDAVVEVNGEISAGTYIEICQTALFVTAPLKRVRIRLDRENCKLISEKL